MSSRIPCGCPFIDQQNIGGHAPEASDRHRTGRPDSTWAEARAYMELYHREKKIPERLASRLEAVPTRSNARAPTGRRLTSSPMAPELPGGTAIDASDDCIGKASDCGTCATSRPRRRYSRRAEHLRVAYNSGKIRPTITVFSPVVPGGVGIRIWNSQLIRYAGYRQGDGSVIGDPLNIALTDALRQGLAGGRRDSL